LSLRLLIVKTSSMGDVVHALPALTDLRAQLPAVEVDWLVEAPFAALPALHPGVREVLPLAWRKWRKRLAERETWRTMGALRERLRAARYDLVLDLQGLLKSALWARQAAAPVAGYDRASAREPLAALLYARTATVARDLHAVQRCRRLAASHLGYVLPGSAPDFGIAPPPLGADWAAPARYAVLIPSASRDEKLWPEPHWVAVGNRLAQAGCTPVVLWGGTAEQQRAQRIAAGCAGVVPPFLSVRDAAALLGRAQVVVGLDTGFSHVAAAFGVPTLGIYCDHEPGLAGITGAGWVRSLGGKGQRPALADVMALVEQQLDYCSSMRSGG
jgi:heptosyltransferase-1